jgi:hypothetical protein
VITLLRSELDLKTGEISEARARINSLESQNHLERVNEVAQQIVNLGDALRAAADRQIQLEKALGEAEDRRLVSLVSLEKLEEGERVRLRELEDVKIA